MDYFEPNQNDSNQKHFGFTSDLHYWFGLSNRSLVTMKENIVSIHILTDLPVYI